MRRTLVLGSLVLLLAAGISQAYVEAPYSLGQVVNESTNIVLVEVVKVNKEKNLVVYKKLKDLKGEHAGEQIKHNIGKSGFHLGLVRGLHLVARVLQHLLDVVDQVIETIAGLNLLALRLVLGRVRFRVLGHALDFFFA